MEDSIEDYIRISKNKKQNNIQPISKDVVLTAEKKRQCNVRALKIVEFAIEGRLHPEVFLKCLPYIDQSYYQDIVEERAISKICGYPICGKKLTEMPNKKYYISTKHNKVYDITDRKNYCSNFCYKAGIHIKNQVDTSPLWMRRFENILKFTLLPSNDSGIPGEEIDQGIAKPTDEASFTSVHSFTEFSLNDVIVDEVGKIVNKNVKSSSEGTSSSKATSLKPHLETINESNENENIQQEHNKKNCKSKSSENIKDKQNDKDNKTEEKEVSVEKEALKDLPVKDPLLDKTKPEKAKSKKSTKKKVPKSPLISEDVESLMKKYLKDWFTLDTHIFIFGKDKIKDQISEEKLIKHFDNLKISENQQLYQKRYTEICRELNLKALADERYDKKVLGDTSLEPLPDYRKLKEDSKILDLKVKSFYGGLPYETEDTNFPASNSEKVQDEHERDELPAFLPPVDSNSQTSYRRNIFLTSSRKAMQALLLKLRIPQLAVISDLQALIKTFDLKADNIMPKPHIWNYISIALLKILSLRCKEISEALNAEIEYTNTLLNDLPSNKGFIDYAVDLISDSNVLIGKYVAKRAN